MILLSEASTGGDREVGAVLLKFALSRYQSQFEEILIGELPLRACCVNEGCLPCIVDRK